MSRDTFLRELKKIRPEGIDFDLKERQRKGVTFRLTGAAVRGTSTASAANTYTNLR